MGNGRFWLQIRPGALLGESRQVYLYVGWVCLLWKHLDEPSHPDRRLESSRSSLSSRQTLLIFQIEATSGTFQM